MADVPPNPGTTVEEQAYTAFVHNYGLITGDVSDQYGRTPEGGYMYAEAIKYADKDIVFKQLGDIRKELTI